MLWAEEVEGITRWKVNTNAMEAGMTTNAGQVGAVGPANEMQKMWAELASQRCQLTEGLAEQGKVLTEVLAQQRLFMGSTTAMLPPFGQQPVHAVVWRTLFASVFTRRDISEGTGRYKLMRWKVAGRPLPSMWCGRTDVFTSHCGTRVSSSVLFHSTRKTPH